MVVLAFALITFSGLTIQLLEKHYPHIGRIINLVENDRLLLKVDVNRATLEELIDVPYIGPYTAGQIILYRKAKGPITSLEQLKQIKGIKEANFTKFARYLNI